MDTNPSMQTVYYDRKINPGLIGIDSRKLAIQVSLTYLWMVLGLLVTMSVAYIVYSSPTLQSLILNSKAGFYSLVSAQFGALVLFSYVASTCHSRTAFILYFIYAATMGTTLSVFLLIYQLTSILSILACTSLSFLGLSLYGLLTKRSLQGMGSFCLSGLFAMVGMMFIFFLFPSVHTQNADLAWSTVGVLVFSGLIAYDSQKLKEMLISAEQMNSKMGSINGALYLYLDFINMFLNLLRLFGSRK